MTDKKTEPTQDNAAPKRKATPKKKAAKVTHKRPTIEAGATLSEANDILSTALEAIVAETLLESVATGPTIARLAALKTNEPKTFRDHLSKTSAELTGSTPTNADLAPAWPFVAKAVAKRIEKRLEAEVDVYVARLVGNAAGYRKPAPSVEIVPPSDERVGGGPGDPMLDLLRREVAKMPAWSRPLPARPVPQDPAAVADRLRRIAGLPPGVLLVVEVSECNGR